MDPSWTPDGPPGNGEEEDLDDLLPDLDAFVGGNEEEEEELVADDAIGEAAASLPAACSGTATLGRSGPRAGDASSSSTSERRELSGNGLRLPKPKDKTKEQRKPRGNLPSAPIFSGDRRADPKCFRKYAAKVDSYVEIAKNIIDDAEIGLRLHAALEGDAADYLEDVPARTFGVEAGWKVLLKVLQDKFGETRMHQVSSAMRGFFRLDLSGKQHTMVEVMDQMDRAARRCKEAELVIPDEIMIYFFFEHAGVSVERQANLLLRTEGKYNWRAMKKAVELLYMNVPVRAGGRDPPQPGRGGRQRQAHEVHGDQFWYQPVPNERATEAQLEAYLLDFDPAERLAENFDLDNCELLPEEVARELHSCFSTHRENRQRLAKAVQARGYFVGGGKSSGKGKGKAKGKSKGGKKGQSKGGRARGMTLDELKAVTTCAECGQKGHWKGDPGCPGAKAVHTAGRQEDVDDEQEYDDGSWYDQGHNQDDWDAWASSRYGFAASRLSRDSVKDPLRREAEQVARGVNRVIGKAGMTGNVTADKVQAAITSDDYLDAAAVKARIEAGRRSTMSTSSTSETIDQAFTHFGIKPVVSKQPSVMDILAKQDNEPIDVDRLRRGVLMTSSLRHSTFTPGAPARGVNSNMRRAPTMQPGRSYLTLDTACENTVAGTTLLQTISGRSSPQRTRSTALAPVLRFLLWSAGRCLCQSLRWRAHGDPHFGRGRRPDSEDSLPGRTGLDGLCQRVHRCRPACLLDTRVEPHGALVHRRHRPPRDCHRRVPSRRVATRLTCPKGRLPWSPLRRRWPPSDGDDGYQYVNDDYGGLGDVDFYHAGSGSHGLCAHSLV